VSQIDLIIETGSVLTKTPHQSVCRYPTYLLLFNTISLTLFCSWTRISWLLLSSFPDCGGRESWW